MFIELEGHDCVCVKWRSRISCMWRGFDVCGVEGINVVNWRGYVFV